MRLSEKIVLASSNREKLEEFRSIFETYPEVEIVPAHEILRNVEKLQFAETYDTYLENALAKGRLGNQGSHYPTLADDSGLECAGLDGKPGVRSHRFASPKAHKTQDEANRELLLKEIQSATNRIARFVCTLVLVIEGIELHATGVLEGSIANAPRGTHGFGYDPIFIPQGETRTLAEMTMAEKNVISHRTKAVKALMASVKAHGIVFAKP